MKRKKVVARFEKVAKTLDLISTIAEQTEGPGAGKDFQLAARMVRREAQKIEERI